MAVENDMASTIWHRLIPSPILTAFWKGNCSLDSLLSWALNLSFRNLLYK